ncbi:MAG: hypothetical protein K9M96_07925 [Deltaproteobacteria bacterium]|nr:hypothetical protein [Deltaproteobacteria bacterium]
MAEKKKEFTFRYVYPDDLRDLYVNGAWGGLTPRKEVNLHFFSERHPIPKSITHAINDDNSVGETVSKELGGDAVRLVQASIVMNLKTAIAVRNWLDGVIKDAQEEE